MTKLERYVKKKIPYTERRYMVTGTMDFGKFCVFYFSLTFFFISSNNKSLSLFALVGEKVKILLFKRWKLKVTQRGFTVMDVQYRHKDIKVRKWLRAPNYPGQIYNEIFQDFGQFLMSLNGPKNFTALSVPLLPENATTNISASSRIVQFSRFIHLLLLQINGYIYIYINICARIFSQKFIYEWRL